MVVVAGYGWCGRGVASRAHGLGANVIVTEVDSVRALEAAMDGFRVMRMGDAAKIGDVFITVTGDKQVITADHFNLMKDGAILCQLGPFRRRDRSRRAQEAHAQGRRGTSPATLTRTICATARRVYLLGQGRLVNLTCAEGHPAQVMDMSFATQALCARWAAKRRAWKSRSTTCRGKSKRKSRTLKLASMGIKIDSLSAEQKHYLTCWETGT